MVSANPNRDKEIGKAWYEFGKHSQIAKCKLSLSLKRIVHNQFVLPVMTYGAEIWHPMRQP